MSNALLASLLGSTFLTALDATSVIIALSAIAMDLQASATESFWISASFLLAMCVAQPVVAGLFSGPRCRSLALSCFLVMGSGALLTDYADHIAMFLAGRSIQGLGAGGLVILTYMSYGDLRGSQASAYLAAVVGSISLGTISGPFIGAILGKTRDWHWLLRINAISCILLGTLCYRSSNDAGRSSRRGFRNDVDPFGIVLVVTAVVPLLAGLSLAGTRYAWTDWRPLLLLTLGSACLLLCLGREVFHPAAWTTWPWTQSRARPMFNLSAVKAEVLVGSFILGFLMYALLFFLLVYFRTVKHHSQIQSALMLLPQTSMLLPCAVMVSALAKQGFSLPLIALAGWFCTSCGVALLALLDADKPIISDVILTFPSGIGIGLLLPSLSLNAPSSRAQTPLVSMRYLGSALGLVVTGIVFQQVLRRELMLTKFRSEASHMTKYATALLNSIRNMPNAQDRQALERATEHTLRTIWIALALISMCVFLLGCTTTAVRSRRKQAAPDGQSAPAWTEGSASGRTTSNPLSLDDKTISETSLTSAAAKSEVDDR